MIRSLTGWALCGVFAGLLTGIVEAAALCIEASHMFFGGLELLKTCLFGIAILSGASTFLAVVLGVVSEGFHRLKKRSPGGNSKRLATLLLAATFAYPVWFLLHRLSSGPQASRIHGREIIVAIATSIIVITVGSVLSWISKIEEAKRFQIRTLAIAGFSVAALAYVVDRMVLVRLYPVFHYALSIIGFGIATGSTYLLARPKPKGRRLVLSFVAVAFFAVACGLSLWKVRQTQNARFVIREKTAAVSDVLALVRHLVPPPKEQILDEIPAVDETGVGVAGNGSAIIRPGANVILLTVDAMRYDRLKLLGATRVVAPNLDSLSKRSVLFSRAYTPMPHTSYAISSFLTGKYTFPLFDIPGVPAAHETWPEILHRFHYETAAFYTRAVFFIDRARFEPYIQTGLKFKHRNVDYRIPASERADQLIGFLQSHEQKERPVFVWAHFFDPHEPYDPDCLRFGPAPEDRYDCEIYRVDRAIGRILAYLEQAWGEAIIIVAADHGEEFGEHGGRFHGTTLYDEQIRVPLLIRVPGLSHRVVDEPVNLVDVLGTCLEILDIPVPARVRSESLVPLMAGKDISRRGFSEIPGKKMVVASGHKLICLDDLDLCELYDLVQDPAEKRSVAAQKPGVADRLKNHLRTWTRSHVRLELRPVEADEMGGTKWPEALRKAIAGEEIEVRDLLGLLEAEERLPVRRKAAELLYRLWSEGAPPILAAEPTDPEVRGWLELLAQKTTGKNDSLPLKEIAPKVEADTPIWRELQLTRLRLEDDEAVESVLKIATSKEAPHGDRVRAIELVGQIGGVNLSPKILPLVSEYQLTIPASRALGALKDRRSVSTLVARLERERFRERKTAIIWALVEIGDKSAAPKIQAALQSIAAEAHGGSSFSLRCADEPPMEFSPRDSPSAIWKGLSKVRGTCDPTSLHLEIFAVEDR